MQDTHQMNYENMIKSQDDGLTLLVGCSADSMMQIYVAEMAKKHNIRNQIFIPNRAKKSALTKRCIELGANITEIPYPCYPSHYRKAAREFANENKTVAWNPSMSTEDTAEQVSNLPESIKRIVVSCGSGAIATGIAIGLILNDRCDVEIVAVKVSTAFGGLVEMVNKIEKSLLQKGISEYNMPKITVIDPTSKYGKKQVESLPDGTELDYTYSAKAYRWMLDNSKEFDLLWISGRRPGLKVFGM